MPRPPAPMSVEDEVLANILAQPLGPGQGLATVEALALPRPFLRRVADRIIRSSFEERYRAVVADGPVAGGDPALPDPRSGGAVECPRVVDAPALSPRVAAYRQSIPEARPPLRNFRAPPIGDNADPWPFEPPEPVGAPALVKAAAVVARRLAADGLLPTLAAAIAAIGPGEFDSGGPREVSLLRQVGLPVDLMDHFGGGAADVIRRVAAAVRDGSASRLKQELRSIPFAFRPACPGFRIQDESAGHPIALLRLQLTSGSYWSGQGAGGSLEVARGLLNALPGAECIASIERKHLAEFLETASHWNSDDASRVRVIAEDLPVAQWAQDSGKPGDIVESGVHKGRATIVPRYASRGEDGSILIPGETFLADSLPAAGMATFRSPLLFQGGNLMAATDPKTGERVLLAGEAEIYRGVSLGLSEAQATEALRIELGADRCVVLPAVSFHIDFEVTFRQKEGRLLAFVNDTAAANAVILSCGVGALARAGVMDLQAARVAQDHLASGRLPEVLSAAAGPVMAGSAGQGRFHAAFAQYFSTGPVDSGAANLHRFLLAMDLTAATLLSPGHMPRDAHARAYLEAIRRREADRRTFHRRLEALGCRLVGIPSQGEGERGINYLNGLHDRVRYLMPAYGGLYEPLDRAAAAAFAAALGPETAVVPIRCGETQRRSGALRCAASVYAGPG